jgi:Ni,Fe-hydrogenase maturation factor
MLSRKTNTVVIGVGNAYSGDDDAGLVAAQRLAQLASDGAMILTETGDAARLIEFWQGANKVKVIILECPTQAITLTEWTGMNLRHDLQA